MDEISDVLSAEREVREGGTAGLAETSSSSLTSPLSSPLSIPLSPLVSPDGGGVI
jgi:hypothetical protein